MAVAEVTYRLPAGLYPQAAAKAGLYPQAAAKAGLYPQAAKARLYPQAAAKAGLYPQAAANRTGSASRATVTCRWRSSECRCGWVPSGYR